MEAMLKEAQELCKTLRDKKVKVESSVWDDVSAIKFVFTANGFASHEDLIKLMEFANCHKAGVGISSEYSGGFKFFVSFATSRISDQN